MRPSDPGHQESKVLEVVIVQRRPTKWRWQVRNSGGDPIMSGWEKTRQAAQYQGYRALFLLLAATSRKSNDTTSA
jgi:hypothetical protein